jgi:DNA helicase-2/ATP-dependent DNA helicase PcrA
MKSSHKINSEVIKLCSPVIIQEKSLFYGNAKTPPMKRKSLLKISLTRKKMVKASMTWPFYTARTLKFQLLKINSGSAQVPYRIIGGQKLYEKKEIKDLIAYLCLIRNPRDQISLRRIINVPHRGIGAVTISKIVEIGKQNRSGILNSMKSHAAANPGKSTAKYAGFPDMIYSLGHIFKEKKLSEAISELVQKIDYYSYIEKSYDSPQQAGFRKLDIEQLILSAERFENKFGKKATLDEFLEKILLADSQDTKDEEEKKNEITLMTLHSSKGLEFEQVYLVGMEEELLPHKRTIVMGEDISEERRLTYVGITRAKQKLIMSYTKERKLYGKVVPRHKSRFLVGQEELYTEQDRTTFGHMTKEEAQEYKSNFFADLSSMLD